MKSISTTSESPKSARRVLLGSLSWLFLAVLGIICFLLCLEAYPECTVEIHCARHLRGMYVYTAITLLALIGWRMLFGPFVYVPLLAGFVSVSIDTGGDSVSQLLMFIFVGLIIGVIVDHNVRQRCSKHELS